MWIVLWIVLSVVAGILGKDRKCGFIGAFICSILLSPIVGFILVLASRQKKTQAELLQDAKTYLETGILNKVQYKEMVSDIMDGKSYTVKYYIEKPTNIYK